MSPRLDYSHWVYALRETYSGTIKIGRARSFDHIDQRLKANQVGCPYPLEVLIRLGPGEHPGERQLHEDLRDFRIRDNGEWFYGNDEVYRLLGIRRDHFPVGAEALLLDAFKKREAKLAYLLSTLECEAKVIAEQRRVLETAGRMLATASQTHLRGPLDRLVDVA